MTNKEAITVLVEIREDYSGEGEMLVEGREALDLAIKALNMVEQLENMRDNVYRLYEAENGNDNYSYGRKQALGAVHSDLEELLEGFDRGGRLL